MNIRSTTTATTTTTTTTTTEKGLDYIATLRRVTRQAYTTEMDRCNPVPSMPYALNPTRPSPPHGPDWRA